MDPRAALGRDGEALVAQYLEDRGYRIIGRNVRVGRLEIDLIAEKAGHVAFVEVRTRRAGSMVHPAETFDYAKRKRIRRAALLWLNASEWHPRSVRFDAAAVTGASPRRPAQVDYRANAF